MSCASVGVFYTWGRGKQFTIYCTGITESVVCIFFFVFFLTIVFLEAICQYSPCYIVHGMQSLTLSVFFFFFFCRPFSTCLHSGIEHCFVAKLHLVRKKKFTSAVNKLCVVIMQISNILEKCYICWNECVLCVEMIVKLSAVRRHRRKKTS